MGTFRELLLMANSRRVEVRVFILLDYGGYQPLKNYYHRAG